MKRMKRLPLVLAAAGALLLPGAARSAACSPLNCSPSQFAVTGSPLVGYRASALGRVTVADLRTGAKRFLLPGGYVDGHVLVHQDGRSLAWYDLRTGTRTRTTTLPWDIRLAGASQDGSRAVGFRLVPGVGQTVVIASPSAWRQVPLPAGQWDFDALRGSNLFLIHYLATGGYQVRLLDLSTDSPTTRVVKDPRESATIWGSPFSRLSSADGRYVFTLYLASNGAAMVHELDLRDAAARCIDLPGTGYFNYALSWGLALAPGGRTLWAANPGYGRVVGIDVASRRVTSAFRFDLPYWNLVDGTRAAVSPGGHELALTDGRTVAVVGLREQKVTRREHTTARAVGYSPTGVLRKLR
jgi:hypothetical protein